MRALRRRTVSLLVATVTLAACAGDDDVSTSGDAVVVDADSSPAPPADDDAASETNDDVATTTGGGGGDGETDADAHADTAAENVDSSPEVDEANPADGDVVEPAPSELPPTAPLVGVIADRDDVARYADRSCGADPLNAFDLVVPDGAADAPLVIFIHGGGFRGGDKSSIYNGNGDITQAVNPLLDAGVAIASINYRLLDGTSREGAVTDGVIVPLTDAQRCVQVIRSESELFGLDRDRVAYMGNSAGAGTALWLGLADDRADPDSDDPIARESTRVRAIAAFEMQSTYDLFRWAEDVFGEFGYTTDLLLAVDAERVLDFYGVDSEAELFSAETEAYRQQVDMLAMVTPDDPPLFGSNRNQPPEAPVTVGQLNHHPNHALFVRDAAAAAGVEHVFSIPRLGIEDPSGETLVEFLLRHLDA